ncbi:hypothetical protein KY342_01755 [Candidatus Woesearchaeota archaeon]|nr:hypothetical protein [Candidatus Woesearchaeota archaeon]
MKKSQISQVFIYIMALFIFALILYYGYYSISSFIKRGEEVVFIKFKTELESEVEVLLPQYGSVSIFNEKKPLKVPGDVEEICFVSSNLISTAIEDLPPSLLNYRKDRTIKLSVAEGAEENVFILPREERPAIWLPHIEVSDDFLCIPTKQARLDIRLESFGNYVKISGQ